MTFADQFRDFMPDTVTIAPVTGRTSDGHPTFGAGVERQARVQRKPRLVRTAAGTEVVATTTVYLADVVAIGIEDQVTLASGPQGKLLAVASSPDEAGDRFTTLYLG